MSYPGREIDRCVFSLMFLNGIIPEVLLGIHQALQQRQAPRELRVWRLDENGWPRHQQQAAARLWTLTKPLFVFFLKVKDTTESMPRGGGSTSNRGARSGIDCYSGRGGSSQFSSSGI
ncbi:hypothetical protein HanXRQr2_Chr03g0097371 [Helianthus annuus]|uniref:Uncharacterized protein n=1 Tax=Helianthus annuus TaxID=4232 RepID=A0A9K3JEW6_HELAN|nr:hypothetical protein HanXRQr2_Chr03g0097371 [Helianthus annuus]KAJ0942590.1 hypothetical protein HanPSC8_Chr03g0093811 [Helianthus annuus]